MFKGKKFILWKEDLSGFQALIQMEIKAKIYVIHTTTMIKIFSPTIGDFPIQRIFNTNLDSTDTNSTKEDTSQPSPSSRFWECVWKASLTTHSPFTHIFLQRRSTGHRRWRKEGGNVFPRITTYMGPGSSVFSERNIFFLDKWLSPSLSLKRKTSFPQ